MLLLDWKRFTKIQPLQNTNCHSAVFFLQYLEWQLFEQTIAGFHCHTIIKAIKQKSRMKEIKEDQYSNSLTKIEVCEMLRVGDTRSNVLLKFIRLCMETPCLCPVWRPETNKHM